MDPSLSLEDALSSSLSSVEEGLFLKKFKETRTQEGIFLGELVWSLINMLVTKIVLTKPLRIMKDLLIGGTDQRLPTRGIRVRIRPLGVLGAG